jgi:uncharacterized protein (TIGR00730 family)
MRVTVYCGSRDEVRPAFLNAAYAFGQALGARKHSLVYGGASVGLMGEVARGALESGAHVTGVLPTFFVGNNAVREIAHQGLHDLRMVKDMHERKRMMIEMSDAFVALPGGMGTLEELFEVITWTQIHLLKKPIALLNTEGFYNKLLEFTTHVVEERFAPEQADIWSAHTHVDLLLDALELAFKSSDSS